VDQQSRRLIVTADDFGLSASVNEAIVRAHRHGILTCASLMVNEPSFDQAVSLARENPRLGVGLHLTLLDGHSTLSKPEIPDLVNERNEFVSSPLTAGIRYFLLRRLRPQLRSEIKAQFQKFMSTGLPLDHVNSHHHLHAHPVVFDILIGLAAETGFSRLRLPFEPEQVRKKLRGPLTWRDRLHLAFHRRMAARCRPVLQQAGIRHNEWMLGLSRTGRMEAAYLEAVIPLMPAGVSEIYAHPSMDACRHELEGLTSVAVRKAIEALNIRLIRFADL
jgi:hopanoid biosynthesis associated protein HpnK